MLRFATRCSPHILSLIVCIGDNYLRRGNNMLRPSGGERTAQSGQIFGGTIMVYNVSGEKIDAI